MYVLKHGICMWIKPPDAQLIADKDDICPRYADSTIPTMTFRDIFSRSDATYITLNSHALPPLSSAVAHHCCVIAAALTPLATMRSRNSSSRGSASTWLLFRPP